MSFKDKIVVVTGATRGIGYSIALHFARKGAHVIITGRTPANVEKAAQDLTAQGLLAEGYVCDVSDGKSCSETLNKILDNQKRIDILVNNAGITRDNLLLRMSDSDWDEVINTNLRGVFNCSKYVAKAMLKARQGRIINIASIIGITGNAGQANYAASKAGIIAFTKSLAKELASRGITVNAVAPGYIKTEMTEQINEKMKEEIKQRIPLGRIGEPEDVAEVCLFLASENAGYITGQTLVVDGGMAV